MGELECGGYLVSALNSVAFHLLFFEVFCWWYAGQVHYHLAIWELLCCCVRLPTEEVVYPISHLFIHKNAVNRLLFLSSWNACTFAGGINPNLWKHLSFRASF